MPKRYFEDLIEGEKLDCNNIIFSRKNIINFAKQFDPQPFHTNVRYRGQSLNCELMLGN